VTVIIIFYFSLNDLIFVKLYFDLLSINSFNFNLHSVDIFCDCSLTSNIFDIY